ncbi:MAG: hypothetical protein ACTSXT_03170 [Candidatus Helarchaeota archaeon]
MEAFWAFVREKYIELGINPGFKRLKLSVFLGLNNYAMCQGGSLCYGKAY